MSKQRLEMLEFLHKYAKLCSFCTQIVRTVPRVVNIGQACRCRCGPLVTRVGLYCHLSGVWLFNLGPHALYGISSSKLFLTAVADVYRTGDAVDGDSCSCSPRAMPSKACCVLGVDAVESNFSSSCQVCHMTAGHASCRDDCG